MRTMNSFVNSLESHAGALDPNLGGTAKAQAGMMGNLFSQAMQSIGGLAGGAAEPASQSQATDGRIGMTEVDGSSTDLSSSDTQTLLNGDYYSSQPQKSTATCPSDVTMDQLMNADGGLLKNMGNQQLTGGGAAGISGGLKDNLARLAGGKPGDIGTNKDVTMRALMILESVKNIPSSNGQMLSASTRHNGNLSGLNPSGEADNGSEVGYLQNMYKDSNYSLPAQRGTSDHMNADDTEKSGAQIFWQDAGKYILPILAAPLMAIPGLGEVAEGAAIAGDVGAEAGIAGAEAGADVAGDAAAAGSAAADAGEASAGAAGAGGSSASSYMSQLASQTAQQMAKEGAKEGAKAGWDQVENQNGQSQPQMQVHFPELMR